MYTFYLQAPTDTPTPTPTDTPVGTDVATEAPTLDGTATSTPTPTLAIPQALYAVSTLESSGQPIATIYTITVGEAALVSIDVVVLVLLIVGIFLLMRAVGKLDQLVNK